ncbi:MAG: hypothetical protein MUD06_15095 [Rhodospirillales bacterium]|nr:hypothetical protein [Rhodospirillales bacterium]
MPPRWARLMWQATPATSGSSKPSITTLSLGPSQRKLVDTAPTSPLWRPAMNQSAAPASTSTATAATASFSHMGDPSV